MPDIVLATLNAKYIHASFGLRYLHANLGDLRERAEIAEFDINQRPLEIVERVLALNPRIVGFGVYIWNVIETTEVVSALKRIAPEIIVVLGGPEVSYETEGQGIVAIADHVVTGEADTTFPKVAADLLAGKPLPKVIVAELPKLDALAFPYGLYTDHDLAHRVIYVEASRGCPFTCEFCLSSLDIPVRAFALEPFLAEMKRLLDRGARQFKFVDRTFNLHLPTSSAILQFFLDHWIDGMFVHFEMIPDRLPEQLRALIAKFPPGALQFEVGIQTFDELASKNISRRQNLTRLADNFHYLRGNTGVHIHADLIVGLPGEGIESFGRGFDQLILLRPQEIQVGILKRLRGTPIVRHDSEYAMIYADRPPYEILQTRDISFSDMQRMRRFARYWDLLGNSGNFLDALPLMWSNGASPFQQMLALSDWLWATLRRTHEIALQNLAESLHGFLVENVGVAAGEAAAAIIRDWQRIGRKGVPAFLETPANQQIAKRLQPKRQSRHVAAIDGA
jgi:radical SAM superfamily enzyme YgiQ (UPF0313 family)